MKARAVVLISGLALAFAPVAGAQYYFGQNQVQYDRFKWKVLETEHFLIYYYPEERTATVDAARMAERSYARLSRILGHQFREKKPLVLYASRADFGQNNVTGDLGEGTGGVTEALRHRMLLPFTGDFKSFEHVLAHEMVHAFQYDIYARGRAGAGLQEMARSPLPLWFAEGMAEYLSLGPNYPITNAKMRDAALNGRIPTIEQMTLRPDRFNPYEMGENLWAYIGGRWGDDVIGEIMNAAPNVGFERAFKNELGLSLEDLGDEWKEMIQSEFLPPVAGMERARKFSQALLTERRTGGEVFIAPVLSDDGKHIAFLSTGDWKRGEVFIDLWLGNAATGKRVKRLVKSTFDPNFEELRLLYSQSAFSPDGKFLAFTAQRKGKDVLYILDVAKQKTVRRLDLPLEGAISPSWSPDGKRLVFSGNVGGITNLYLVDADGRNFRQLTDDRYGDMQPQWSPDGRTIAFASDRGPNTNIDLLRFAHWRISLLDLETGRIDVVPDQKGLNLNPMWAPDGKSLAYVSDRSGTPNIFLYEIAERAHYQLTNVIGAVTAFSEYSPVITWARQADRIAFTYFENDNYTVWAVDRPRTLKRAPYRDSVATAGPMVAAVAPSDSLMRGTRARPQTDGAMAANGATTLAPLLVDTTSRRRSVYRSPAGIRPSSNLPGDNERKADQVISVAALLDSASLALPDTSKFKAYSYKVRYQPDYVVRPSIGYAQDNLGRGVFGGTTIVLSDMLGNNRLAFSGEVNGRISEARVFAGYTNLSRRFQYSTGVYQEPLYFLAADSYREISPVDYDVSRTYFRYIIRQAYGTGIYPLNRFTRFEIGARLNNIDRTALEVVARVRNGYTNGFQIEDVNNASSLNYAEPFVAYVSDNTLGGYTGPIMGRRYRFEIQPTIGSYRWVEYLADYRRYQPLIFNFLTVAVRGMSSLAVGRDETVFPKYIGYPQFVRGYDREEVFTNGCGGLLGGGRSCRATELVGSRVALANAELRFPLIRRFELGLLPIALPPLDGLVFYDAGVAWSRGQRVEFDREKAGDDPTLRVPVTSYGAGLRLNLFGFAVIRWDYAIPISRPDRKGFWSWSIGPSF